MILQGADLPNREEVNGLKKTSISEKEEALKEKAETIKQQLLAVTQRCVKLACEKGASSWLSVKPLAEHGFTLNKGEFRDAIALRYNKVISDIPSTCPCGAPFNINHALNCKRGGLSLCATMLLGTLKPI